MIRFFRLALAVLAFAAAAASLRAQGGIATSGGLELVLPVGARAVGMGQAVVADQLGTESIWWNPAALGRMRDRDLAVHHSQTFTYTGDAVALVVPVAPVGVVAVSASLYNQGQEEVTDATGSFGTITPQTEILAATFAADVTPWAYVGLSYKFYHAGTSCTGACNLPGALSGSTTAIDFGMQFRATRDSSLYLGVALRNVGPRLQYNDGPQADPLPTRLDVGLTYTPRLEALGPDAQLRVGAGMVNAVPSTGPGFRFGGELAWQRVVHVTAGYVVRGSAGSGPAIGAGLATGRLQFDIARLFSDAAGTGDPPTYFSLRYVF